MSVYVQNIAGILGITVRNVYICKSEAEVASVLMS